MDRSIGRIVEEDGGYSHDDLLRRARVIGISREDDELLARAAPVLLEHGRSFVDRFYRHLASFPETASLLRSPDLVERLKRTQIEYFRSLLKDPVDWSYILGRLRTGSTHQRVGVRPKWYIGSFSMFLSHHIPLIPQACESPDDVAPTICALIRRVLFDMSLVLDAYGIVDELQTLKSFTADGSAPQPKTSSGTPKPSNATVGRPRGIGINVDVDEMQRRLAFHGIDEGTVATLSQYREVFLGRAERAIEEFHGLVRRSEITTKEPLSEPTLQRLKRAAHEYWAELFSGRFDRPYSLSRVRIGMVHERIGVSFQWYLVALAVELTSLVKTSEGRLPAPVDAVGTLLRVAMFDVSYIVEAYIEARIRSLVESRGFAEHVVRNMTTGMLLLDEAARVTSANWAVLKILGMAPENIHGLPIAHVIPAVTRDVLASISDPNLAQEVTVDERISDKDCRLRIMRIRGDDGEQRTAILLDDLSPVFRYLQSVGDRKDNYEHIIDRLRLAAWEADAETGVLEFVSSALDELVPSGDWRALGRSSVAEALVAPADRDAFDEACRRAVAGETVELEHRIVPEESKRWVRSWIRLVPTAGGGQRLRGDVHEVTQAVHTRLELVERLGYQRQSLELVRDSMSAHDEDRPILRLLQMLGTPPFVDAAFLLTRVDEGEWTVAASDGDHAELPAGALDRLAELDPRSPSLCSDDAEGGTRWCFTVPMQPDARGNTVVLVMSRVAQPLPSAFREFAETVTGIASAWVGHWIGNEASVRRQRLEALGTLATGIAHDLNNVLEIIGLAVDELEAKGRGSVTSQMLSPIRVAVDRGATLVGDIMAFTRHESEVEHTCNVAKTVGPLVRMLRAVVPTTIELHVGELHDARVALDPSHLEQIIVNLTTNAAQAIGNRAGRISIVSDKRVTEAELPMPLGALSQGEYLVIVVEDDGPGVPEDLEDHVFAPFFTTRHADGGTGLGLAAAARMASEQGGGVRLARQQSASSGARFEVWLRLIEDRPEAPRATDGDDRVDIAGTRILLAEDEAMIARTMTKLLRDLGCEVTTCPDGTSALAALTDELDVIIVDHNMPGLGGIGVLREAARRCPHARLILASGHDVTLPADLEEHGVRALFKPFSLRTLTRMISK